MIALNKFNTDTDDELNSVEQYCRVGNLPYAVNDSFARGGEGALRLAEQVIEAVKVPSRFTPFYKADAPLTEKLACLAEKVYALDGIEYSARAEKQLNWLDKHGFGNLPVCVAKTQYAIGGDGTRNGRTQTELSVQELKLSAGAGFVVALTGSIVTMPGLPKHPAALEIDIDDDGKISGLF